MPTREEFIAQQNPQATKPIAYTAPTNYQQQRVAIPVSQVPNDYVPPAVVPTPAPVSIPSTQKPDPNLRTTYVPGYNPVTGIYTPPTDSKNQRITIQKPDPKLTILTNNPNLRTTYVPGYNPVTGIYTPPTSSLPIQGYFPEQAPTAIQTPSVNNDAAFLASLTPEQQKKIPTGAYNLSFNRSGGINYNIGNAPVGAVGNSLLMATPTSVTQKVTPTPSVTKAIPKFDTAKYTQPQYTWFNEAVNSGMSVNQALTDSGLAGKYDPVTLAPINQNPNLGKTPQAPATQMFGPQGQVGLNAFGQVVPYGGGAPATPVGATEVFTQTLAPSQVTKNTPIDRVPDWSLNPEGYAQYIREGGISEQLKTQAKNYTEVAQMHFDVSEASHPLGSPGGYIINPRGDKGQYSLIGEGSNVFKTGIQPIPKVNTFGGGGISQSKGVVERATAVTLDLPEIYNQKWYQPFVSGQPVWIGNKLVTQNSPVLATRDVTTQGQVQQPGTNVWSDVKTGVVFQDYAAPIPSEISNTLVRPFTSNSSGQKLIQMETPPVPTPPAPERLPQKLFLGIAPLPVTSMGQAYLSGPPAAGVSQATQGAAPAFNLPDIPGAVNDLVTSSQQGLGQWKPQDLTTYPIYQTIEGGVNWYNTNVAKPFENYIAPLTSSPTAQKITQTLSDFSTKNPVGYGIAQVVPWLNFGTGVEGSIFLNTPKKLSIGSQALVSSPAAVGEMIGMAPVGAEIIYRNVQNTNSLAPLAAATIAGLGMQGQSVVEGAKNPTKFVWENVGMIALFEGGRAVITPKLSPFGLDTVTIPRSGEFIETTGAIDKFLGKTTMSPDVNTYKVFYTKTPFSSESSGGTVIFGKYIGYDKVPGARVGPKLDVYTSVGSEGAQLLNPADKTVQTYSTWFTGKPTKIMEATKIRMSSGLQAQEGTVPWSRGEFTLMQPYIEQVGRPVDVKLWQGSRDVAYQIADSKLYQPQQVEPFGQAPTAGATPATMQQVISTFSQEGKGVISGGSRSLAPWVGSENMRSIVESDFDTYMSKKLLEPVYGKTKQILQSGDTGISSSEITTTGPIDKQGFHISSPKQSDFINVHAMEAYPTFSKSPMKVEVLTPKEGTYILNPRQQIKAKVGGMVEGWTQEPGKQVKLVHNPSRVKDIVDTISISRAVARDLYEAPMRFDVGGAIANRRIGMAEKAEAFSNTLQDYIETQVKRNPANYGQAQTMLGEIKENPLDYVNRNPRADFDIIRTPADMVNRRGLSNDYGMMFPPGEERIYSEATERGYRVPMEEVTPRKEYTPIFIPEIRSTGSTPVGAVTPRENQISQQVYGGYGNEPSPGRETYRAPASIESYGSGQPVVAIASPVYYTESNYAPSNVSLISEGTYSPGKAYRPVATPPPVYSSGGSTPYTRTPVVSDYSPNGYSPGKTPERYTPTKITNTYIPGVVEEYKPTTQYKADYYPTSGYTPEITTETKYYPGGSGGKYYPGVIEEYKPTTSYSSEYTPTSKYTPEYPTTTRYVPEKTTTTKYTPKTPKTPYTPSTPKENYPPEYPPEYPPTTPKYPGYPPSPNYPGYPPRPEYPEYPQSPEYPKYPKTPEKPIYPKTPARPVYPNYPKTPTLPLYTETTREQPLIFEQKREVKRRKRRGVAVSQWLIKVPVPTIATLYSDTWHYNRDIGPWGLRRSANKVIVQNLPQETTWLRKR